MAIKRISYLLAGEILALAANSAHCSIDILNTTDDIATVSYFTAEDDFPSCLNGTRKTIDARKRITIESAQINLCSAALSSTYPETVLVTSVGAGAFPKEGTSAGTIAISGDTTKGFEIALPTAQTPLIIKFQM